MDIEISRSEKKRRAKSIEDLAKELIDLSENAIKKLPCEDWLRKEIAAAAKLKGPARKRQIKYISREIRKTTPDELLQALAEKKGSKLKEKREFHELEHLRERIIDEVLALHEEAQRHDTVVDTKEWQSALLDSLGDTLPELDLTGLKKAAASYAATRKPSYSREIFRLLTAAKEKARFRKKGDADGI